MFFCFFFEKIAQLFDSKYSTDNVVTNKCGDTAAEDEESDYSDDLVWAEEVTASTCQEDDNADSCSDILLASSPDSSLRSEESSIVDPDISLPSEESCIDEPDSSLSSEESAIIDTVTANPPSSIHQGRKVGCIKYINLKLLQTDHSSFL